MWAITHNDQWQKKCKMIVYIKEGVVGKKHNSSRVCSVVSHSNLDF